MQTKKKVLYAFWALPHGIKSIDDSL